MLVVGLVEVKTLMLVVGSNSASSDSFYADLCAHFQMTRKTKEEEEEGGESVSLVSGYD